MKNRLNGLYVITDDTLTPSDKIFQSVEQVLQGGAKIVQLRDKTNSTSEIEDMSLKLQELCHRYDALFVLNDKVEIAIKLGLDGLHVGKEDYHNIQDVRKNFKGILGVSCYDDLEMAKNMQKAGVDYVAFGACFSSSTKPNASTMDLEILKQAKDELNIPICVIGGINTNNIKTLLGYKPDMVAIISDIWKNEDIKERAMLYSKILSQN